MVDKHAPWKLSKVKGRHLLWINSELLSLLRQRDRAWTIFRQTRELADWLIYRQLRNILKTKVTNALSNYFKLLNTDCFCDPFKDVSGSELDFSTLHNPTLIA